MFERLTGRATFLVDGGSWGGHAGIGIVALNEKGAVARTEWWYIGQESNNMAEVRAIIRAVVVAAECGLSEVVIMSDSRFAVNTLGGLWVAQNDRFRGMVKLFNDLCKSVDSIELSWAPREMVELADGLVGVVRAQDWGESEEKVDGRKVVTEFISDLLEERGLVILDIVYGVSGAGTIHTDRQTVFHAMPFHLDEGGYSLPITEDSVIRHLRAMDQRVILAWRPQGKTYEPYPFERLGEMPRRAEKTKDGGVEPLFSPLTSVTTRPLDRVDEGKRGYSGSLIVKVEGQWLTADELFWQV